MMKQSDIKDVVIIGGGISGLATAYRLQTAPLDILLLEKNSRLGGSILTEERDGFLVDCGPNSTLDTTPAIREFIREIGLQESRINANPNASRRYILRDGKLQALPMSPPNFLSSKLFSWQAKFRLLAEPFIAAAPEDKEESIAEFVKRRLGQEFLDYAINPFIAGVYAGDPEKLSVRSAVAKIYALEKNYGSLIKGAIKGAKERKKRGDTDKTKAQLFSFRNGMRELINRLVEKLGSCVKTGCTIEKILPSAESDLFYTIQFATPDGKKQVKTKSVVFTTPAFVTAKFLKPLSDSVGKRLEEITYPPVAMVFLGYKQQPQCRALDGFGFLVPQVENRKILGCIWSSTLFPNRAPAGGIALTTFVGGMRQPQLLEQDDQQLSETVLRELGDILNLKGKPDVIRIKRWEKAIPQYEIGHQSRIAALDDFEDSHPGIFISGNYREGISVGDCIVNSEKVTQKVMTHLQNPKTRKISQDKKLTTTI